MRKLRYLLVLAVLFACEKDGENWVLDDGQYIISTVDSTSISRTCDGTTTKHNILAVVLYKGTCLDYVVANVSGNNISLFRDSSQVKRTGNNIVVSQVSQTTTESIYRRIIYESQDSAIFKLGDVQLKIKRK